MYRTRRLATWNRSVRLLRSFAYEQFRPAIFYGGLARDTALLIDALSNDLTHSPLQAKNVLDVGGGPGYFAAEYHAVQKVKGMLAAPMITAIAAVFIVSFPILYYGNPLGYSVAVGLEVAALLFAGGTVLSSVARWYRNRPEFVVGRFCRALAMGIEAGLPLGSVTEFAVAAAGHPELQAHLSRVPLRERGNQPLAKTFGGCRVLPFEVVAALEVADATGNYSDTLVKLAQMYDVKY